MFGKVVLCFAALSLAVAIAHPDPNDPDFIACKAAVDALSSTGDKRSCMMTCIGVKKGSLNADFSMNVAKKTAWASSGPFKDKPTELAAFTAAVTACKDSGKGAANYCDAGAKIHACMEANNAPRPPHGPH